MLFRSILLSTWAARRTAELIDDPAAASQPGLVPVRPDRFCAPQNRRRLSSAQKSKPAGEDELTPARSTTTPDRRDAPLAATSNHPTTPDA